MIIGISLFSPRMIFVASSPFITGILMSIRIALASLPYSLNSATISSPFLAHCISHFFPMIALINLKLLSSCRFMDMMYMEIHDYLPPEFQMLLIASPSSIQEREVSNLVCLSMPMKVHELLQTIEMMEGDIQRRRRRMRQQPKHRSQEDQQIIRKAKELLMARNSFTEEEAHKYIQKRSMDNGTGLVEVAQMILSLLQEG